MLADTQIATAARRRRDRVEGSHFVLTTSAQMVTAKLYEASARSKAPS